MFEHALGGGLLVRENKLLSFHINFAGATGMGGANPSPKKVAAVVKREGASPTKSLTTAASASSSSTADPSNKDNLFYQFRHLCRQLEKEPGYNAKTKIVSNFIKFGSSGGTMYIIMLSL